MTSQPTGTGTVTSQDCLITVEQDPPPPAPQTPKSAEKVKEKEKVSGFTKNKEDFWSRADISSTCIIFLNCSSVKNTAVVPQSGGGAPSPMNRQSVSSTGGPNIMPLCRKRLVVWLQYY